MINSKNMVNIFLTPLYRQGKLASKRTYMQQNIMSENNFLKLFQFYIIISKLEPINE